MSETTPDTVAAWHRNAHAALGRRDFAATEQYCRKILANDPRDAHAHFLLAMLALETRQILPATKLLERAIALDPQRADYHAQLGRALVILARPVEAGAAAARALALEPTDALTLDTIGCIYSHIGAHAEAVQPFAAAVKLQPGNPDFQFNLASSLRFLGDFGGAEKAYESAISADPAYYKAHWSLAYLRRQTAATNHVARLRNLLQDVSGNFSAEAFTHNALAKELDDLDDPDEAFHHLASGKQLIRARLDYSIAEDQKLFACITGLFTQNLLGETVDGCSSEEPVFVVGMPRTGTTLVERILSSHSAVYSAGELRNFALQLKQASGTKSARVLDEETLEKGLTLDSALLGQMYIDSTRPGTGHTARFIDKTPLNFLNIGFIHRALPKARIICLRRNPLDTCLSNFRQMFSPDSSPYYKYSFDLLETGQYYLLFDRLMAHWEQVLPGKVLQVSYEDIVADQEVQSRRLIDFCGLEWEDACLAFEKNTAPVATASSVQVRQPIYTSATSRWKRYEKHLAPLRELLEKNGVQI